MIAATALRIKANGLAKLATSVALLGAPSSLPPSVPAPPVGSDEDSSLVEVASDEELVLLSVGLDMVVFLDIAVPVAALPLAPTPVPTAPPAGMVVVLLSITEVVVLLTTTDCTTRPVAPPVVEGEEDEDEAVTVDAERLDVELADEEELETALLPVMEKRPE
ncbi:MAG: hypothetical protein Q9221_003696 [Calogaya cf. arnoldii]